MRPPSCLCDASALVVIDASTAINLNATGVAAEILRAIPHRVVLPEAVLSELQNGTSKGRNDREKTGQLISARLISVAELEEVGWRHFETLVVGETIATLDDGEAATIAHALEAMGVAVIDERKARRICEQQFPDLQLAATMDILSHPDVERALGQEVVSGAVFNALQNARMRVTSSYLPWVVELIGESRATLCKSLPRVVRRSATSG
jgi:predicted nucleic acid-binding protein